MGVSDQQLVLEERRPKRLVHRSLGGYRGEARLMILYGIVRTILRWSGAIHRIPLSLHFKLLTRNGTTFSDFFPLTANNTWLSRGGIIQAAIRGALVIAGDY